MNANTVGGCREVAELLGVTAGRVRKLCQEGRIVGAEQIGAGWVIPLPPVIKPPKSSHRKQGRISDTLPDFLGKRLPKGRP